MKKFIKISKSLIFLLAAVAGITSLVLQFKQDNPELDIKTISKERLTKIPNENGFEASYLFNDIPVENLWRINVLIENTGTTHLIGKGTQKHLDLLPKNCTNLK